MGERKEEKEEVIQKNMSYKLSEKKNVDIKIKTKR